MGPSKISRKFRIFCSYCMAFTEYSLVFVFGKVLGLPIVVRYLRNPNPIATPWLVRAFGGQVGQGTTFKRALLIDNAYEDANSAGDFRHLRIGRNCYIGDSVYVDLSNEITMGDNVVISGRVSLITHADCNRSEHLAAIFPRQCLPVRIGDGAWIGFAAVLLAGTTVGSRTVVAAGSLLRGSAECDSVYCGIPAGKTETLRFECASRPACDQ